MPASVDRLRMSSNAPDLRLLVVTQQFPQGGAEAFLAPELTALAARVDALFIVPRSPGGRVTHGDAAPFLPNATVRGLVTGEILLTALRTIVTRPRVAAAIIGLLLRSRSPGVFLRNCGVLPKGLWLGEFARELKVNHIHSHWAATVSTMALIASMVADVPWSLTAHRWDIVEDNLLREKSRAARLVRFISESGVRLAAGKLSEGANAKVIHLGVEPQPVAAPHPAGRPFTVLCAANLKSVKGHGYLVEAVALLNGAGVPARLLIAGRGELEADLRRQVDDLELGSSVEFLGVVPHDVLLSMYGGGDVDAVALPSVDLGGGHHEGIPVSLMEAMSFGIPVVSTTTGGIPELLGDDAGVLVPPADAPALARALRWLAANPAEAAALGLRGRAKVTAEFSAEEGATALLRELTATLVPR